MWHRPLNKIDKRVRMVIVTAVNDTAQERQLIVVDVVGKPLDLDAFFGALDDAIAEAEARDV
jgi:hypothetical protein